MSLVATSLAHFAARQHAKSSTRHLVNLLEEVMEDFAKLMQRLLEIQSGGRPRSPELVEEDERLVVGLQKKILTRKLGLDRPDQTRFKA